MMSVKTCKVEPLKGQTPLRSSKTKQDAKPYSCSSPPSIKAYTSPFVSQKTSRRVALSAEDIKNAHREATKISSSSCGSSKWTGNFILMVELRRKIINFRTIIDLPPLTYYLSISNMVMRTMKDLHKLCPEIIDSSQILEMRREEVDKLLDNFYNALKSIGDSWIDDHEWIIKSKYRSSNIRKNLSDRLVEKVLAALDGLIKGMNERLNTTENGNVEMKKKVSPRSTKTSNDRSESLAKQPIRPKTVLSPPSKVHGDFSISVSNLPRNVRMQALVKLSPIDVKRLAIQNFSQKEALSNNGDGDDESLKVKKSETEEKAKEAILEKQDSVKSQIDDKDCSKVSVKSEMVSKSFAPPPPPPPGNAAIPVEPPLTMSAEKESYAPLPPPPGRAALPPPPPLPMAVRKGVAAPPLPPPGTAALPPPPPLPMAAGKGVAAPPPPPPGARGGLGAKKVTSKLKRSTHLGALFRFLKGKLEGKNPEVRSRGAGGGSKGASGSAPASGKQGMADALAEITKKSPYFQKIEEDVRMYMTSINELKTDITKFKNKDITELQKFHHRIESVLEKLEDETQVLARCEGFPHKKLEAIRMAAALYSKLEGMIKELKNWKIESPANQLYDKTERYFAKIRKEIETLDQIKAEEEKKFKSNNIHFDFNILVQIKELMVDISSGCMELALKEKREAKIASQTTAESLEAKPSTKNKTPGWAKTLWRAFHFAYRVYTFAGGHDDRADKLTRELGEEIEQILGNQ
ncbi:unnamed protein product [Arabidopsis thaliana]|uniref:(thale cress) hypothetical protein n=1 Tax=Arabidopsis thaliana TaxID=3702 RepID=A0A7G2DQ01_ARATH|nr:unnamed protein product [Arabidopsis thaliana]